MESAKVLPLTRLAVTSVCRQTSLDDLSPQKRGEVLGLQKWMANRCEWLFEEARDNTSPRFCGERSPSEDCQRQSRARRVRGNNPNNSSYRRLRQTAEARAPTQN